MSASGSSLPFWDQVGLELKRRGDDLLALGFRMQAPAWPRQGRAIVERTRADAARGRQRFEERGWLDAPIEFHRAPPRLARPSLRKRRLGWIEYEELAFESAYRPHRGDPGAARYAAYRSNATAHAWLLRSDTPERPWVVCIHGYGMGTPAIDLFAFGAERLRSRLGLNVACLVLPFHGPRAVGNAGSSELIRTGISNMLHCQSQALSDARRLIGWLREQGASRVGVHGVSLGGNVAALLASVDPELDAVTAGVPATDFLFSYRQAQRRVGETDLDVPDAQDPIWADLEQTYRVISPLAVSPVLARDRLGIYAGEVDGVVPAAGVRALWRHWERPAIGWYPGGHVGFLGEAKAQTFVEQRMRELAA